MKYPEETSIKHYLDTLPTTPTPTNKDIDGFVIRSLLRWDDLDPFGEPKCYFVTIHGYTPFFSTVKKAKRFSTTSEAWEYALKELFTSEKGVFDICYAGRTDTTEKLDNENTTC